VQGEALIGRVLGAAAPPLGATLRIVASGAADVARALDLLDIADGDVPDDWLEARDPDYIRATLPAMRLLGDVYFRADVRGLERIPAEGPVLLVGNHSGGTLIADTFIFGERFYTRFGPGRPFHQLAHDLLFRLPGPRASLSRYGTVPASPENMRRALDRGAALLVYPGGDHETYRPSWESDRIDFAGRTGFVELALELGVPLVPVVSIGGQETALFLGQGSRIARALRLDRTLRVKVFPVQIAPPAGVTLLDLPLRIPLPAKITTQVLPPIELAAERGAGADVADGYRLVTEAMQAALSDLAAERTLPVLG
jgi:1-acyl-sn-glycerol-3-phosphate acyltransferase